MASIPILLSKKALKTACISFCLALYLYPSSAQFKTAKIDITDEEMQEFSGLGFSIHKGKAYFIPSDPAKKEYLYSETFRSFNTIVFWSYIEEPELRDAFINEALKYGLKRIIVNPTGEPSSPLEHANNVLADIKEYIIAGYPIYGTTIMNKPNTDESGTLRQDPTFLAECAKLLRFKLDSAGYEYVKIGGPSTIEWSPYIDPTDFGAAHGYSFQDGDNQMYLDALINDPDALAVMDAFDFQSYGWSVRSSVQEKAKLYNKDLWVTLSATDGKNNNNADPVLGPISVANLLANLNHGVSSWNHWVWDQFVNFSTALPNKRMKMIQQIGDNFKEGAVVMKCKADNSQVSENMAWNYFDLANPANSQQPDLVASSVRNPDNSVAFGLVNTSGIHAQHFASVYAPAEASVYDVSVNFKELENKLALFSIYSTSNEGTTTQKDKVIAKNGNFDILIPSQQLIIARSDTILIEEDLLNESDIPGDFTASLNEAGQINLSWIDNSTIEDGFLLMRREKGSEEFNFSEELSPGTTSYLDDLNIIEGKEFEYLLRVYKDYDLGSIAYRDTLSSENTSIYIQPVGIHELLMADVELYPNPGNGLVHLKMNRYPAEIRVSVFNTQGSKVFTTTSDPRNPINLEHLDQGIYYLQLESKQERVIKKLIINR